MRAIAMAGARELPSINIINRVKLQGRATESDPMTGVFDRISGIPLQQFGQSIVSSEQDESTERRAAGWNGTMSMTFVSID
jgi:hypothetical protein